MKAYAYETATNPNPSKLDDDICKRLEDGWELYGNPYTVSDVDGTYICQALIMDKESFEKAYVIDKTPQNAPIPQRNQIQNLSG